MGNLSPRAIRERVTRTPRTSPLSSPASDADAPASPKGASEEDDDPTMADFIEHFRTNTMRRIEEEERRRKSASSTVPVPLDPHNEVETPPYAGLTASGAHRLRLSIVSRLPPDDVDSPFWIASLPPPVQS